MDGLVAGTVAANSSTVIDNMKPGVYVVSGNTPPGVHRAFAVGHLDAGQTV